MTSPEYSEIIDCASGAPDTCALNDLEIANPNSGIPFACGRVCLYGALRGGVVPVEFSIKDLKEIARDQLANGEQSDDRTAEEVVLEMLQYSGDIQRS